MASFIYPAADTSGQAYTYNYNDFVNVSWSGNAPPPGASLHLSLFLSVSGNDTLSTKDDVFVATSGSYLSGPLNFTDFQYPGVGHYQLRIQLENGSVVLGQNSAKFRVTKDDTAAFQCMNCTAQASSSIAPASPTGTTASNGAATAVTSPGPLIPSGQSSSPSGGLTGGPIAGIVIGVVIVVAIAGVLGAFYQRRRTKGRKSHQIARTEGSQESKEGVHRPDQETELSGRELSELHNSAQPAEKD